MYVKPAYRGHGISKLILSELEKWAAEMGFKNAVLETGRKHHEAIGLYKGTGYKEISNYGPYKHMPDSLCFGKALTSDQAIK